MPRKWNLTKALLPLGLIVVAAHAVFGRRADDWEYEEAAEETAAAPAPAAPAAARRPRAARTATVAAFTALFFAGAAFTAGAGDQAVRLLEEDAAALAAAQSLTTPTEDAVTAPEAPAEPAPAPEPAPAEPAPAPAPAEPTPEAVEPATDVAPEAQAEPAPAAAPAPTPAGAAALEAEPPEAEASAPATAPAAVRTASATPAAPAPAKAAPQATPAPAKPARPKPAGRVVVPAAPVPEPEIEAEHGDDPTVWLNRELPDPTPASARLTKRFAKQLRSAAGKRGADWALVLAVLRAQDLRGSAPATAAELDALAERVAKRDPWKAALALSGETVFADEVSALRDLYRSVGLQALVEGYAKAKERLAERLLQREGVWIYDGGRRDIEAGRIDVRVVVLLSYLAERYDTITVSSLFSGHRMFSRPGVVSAHMYGQAVDIASLGGTPIFGNSQPGGTTEDAVRSTLLLPSELQPRQVISLLGLGGPSFPMRSHADHIHVGF